MTPAEPGTLIIAVGDEILGGFIVDTNSHWLAQRVREAGYPATRIEVVPDRLTSIAAAVRTAVADPEATRIIVSGGLGPTTDDRTIEAVAAALDRPLEEHPDAVGHVRGIVERMHRAGWLPSAEPSEGNLKMTVVPRGAIVLFNRRGMAPGLAYRLGSGHGPDVPGAGETGERWLFVLPGVPREFQAIVDEEVLPRFFTGSAAPDVGELHYRYAIEADFLEPMRTLEREFPDVAVGSYPQTETRELIIRVRGARRDRVQAALARLRALRPPDE